MGGMNEQILELLAQHPEGLTTAQIFDIAKKRRLNQIPDTVALSNAIWVLRERKLAVEVVGGQGRGRLYGLTAEGKGLLGDDDVGSVALLPANVNPGVANPVMPSFDDDDDESNSLLGIPDLVDLAWQTIRAINDIEALLKKGDALAEFKALLNDSRIVPVVRFKSEKLALLDKFMEICKGSDAEGLVAGIRADLAARTEF